MRFTRLGLLPVMLLICHLGCQTTDRSDLRVPHVEEFTPPPQENRYNNPPEAGYTAPPPKKEFRPGPGGGAGPGMPMPGNGGF